MQRKHRGGQNRKRRCVNLSVALLAVAYDLHQLIGLLGCCIQRYRVIDLIIRAVRHFFITTVYVRTRRMGVRPSSVSSKLAKSRLTYPRHLA